MARYISRRIFFFVLFLVTYHLQLSCYMAHYLIPSTRKEKNKSTDSDHTFLKNIGVPLGHASCQRMSEIYHVDHRNNFWETLPAMIKRLWISLNCTTSSGKQQNNIIDSKSMFLSSLHIEPPQYRGIAQKGSCKLQGASDKELLHNLSVKLNFTSLEAHEKKKNKLKVFFDRISICRNIYKSNVTHQDSSDKNKYDSYAKSCNTHGSWNIDCREELRCVFLQAANKMNLHPYETVLDWGSGCGHQMAFIGSVFGSYHFGIDISPNSAKWSRENLPEQHRTCCRDGFDLTPLPSNSFDGIMSYAAMYHLDYRSQCQVLHSMLRIVKAGRKIWIGWVKRYPVKSYEGVTCSMWKSCLDSSKIPSDMECFSEMKHFGTTAYNWDIHDSLFVTKLHDS